MRSTSTLAPRWRRGRPLQLGAVTLTATGAVVNGMPPFEEWERVLAFASRCEGAVLWWLGDLINYGETTDWGEKYTQAMESSGLDYGTVRNAKYVAGRLELSRRRDTLPFAHHQEVAPLSPDEQSLWLGRAEREGWTRAELRKRLRQEKQRAALTDAGNFPGTAYRVLYADPPWEYSDQRTGFSSSGAAAAHYPTLPTADICNLADPSGRAVRDLAAGDSVLFLWATAPCHPAALAVMSAWGFEYKAQFVWDKVRGFNGHYNDVQHELLLVGLRGSCQPAPGPLHKSIVRCEKDRHSRKPDVFYEIIESMYPVGPRLELFSRNRREGWDSWGNEA
jgi:N6-adenosine-specific RNA methylase IME4